MKITPTAGRVYVRVLKQEQSRSGIWLPEQRNERTLKVEVLEVGIGKPAPIKSVSYSNDDKPPFPPQAAIDELMAKGWEYPRIPPQVKHGDVCLLPFYNRGGEIPEERDVLIVKEEEIIAIVTEEATP